MSSCFINPGSIFTRLEIVLMISGMSMNMIANTAPNTISELRIRHTGRRSLSFILCLLFARHLSQIFSRGTSIVLIINARQRPIRNGEKSEMSLSIPFEIVCVLVAAQYITNVNVMIMSIYLRNFLLRGITIFCSFSFVAGLVLPCFLSLLSTAVHSILFIII